MNIIKNSRKKELYDILKELFKLALKNDYKNYINLKKDFNNLIIIIFGHNLSKGEEGFEWDFARNQTDNIITIRNAMINFSNNEKLRLKYEKMLKEHILKTEKIIEDIKKLI
jgi:hypothetical protein